MADLNDLKRRMEGALDSLRHDLNGLRTGRASVNLLDSVQADAYGSLMPINQLSSISAPEPRMLVVQVWDKGMVQAVEKAIRDANLGLNPATEGQLIRVPMPDLTEERRKEMVKVAHKYAENARISIRNVRRDGMESIKKEEKAGKISEDEMHDKGEEVQKITDEFIGRVDESLKNKEKDILTV